MSYGGLPCAYRGPFPNRGHRSLAELDRRAPAAADADLLAYFARKRRNAETMAERSPEFAAEARWTIRQIDVFTDDIRAGLHRGEAALAEASE